MGALVSSLGFAGRVIVVAGEGERIDRIAAILLEADAIVAVVGNSRTATAAHVSFSTDTTDPAVWTRVIPHVEQRLGPIDAAVSTSALQGRLRELLGPDLERRGHGGVVDVDAARDVDDAIRQLATLL